MEKLLFVDDDKNILKINRSYFENKGFIVYTAETFKQAIDCLEKNSIDCAILDILLAGEDGFLLCEKIRKELTLPIIFLTSLSQKDFLYRGFSVGGDDYITKPYDIVELEMRIIASLNRSRTATAPKQRQLVFPPLTIDVHACMVFINNKVVALTTSEFDILLLLASSPNNVFSAEYIYRNVWRMPDLNNTSTVQVHIARLRRKLIEACPERSFLGTVWKKGYKFIPNDEK